MKILVTGGDGMLGSALLRRLAAGVDGGPAPEASGIDLPDGDLTDAAVAAGLVARHAPDWIIHCAAWTDVDGAEARFDDAMAANGQATANLAMAARAATSSTSTTQSTRWCARRQRVAAWW